MNQTKPDTDPVTIPANRFQIERYGNEYTMIVNTGVRYRVNRYRNKRHGRKKWFTCMEPIGGSGCKRIAIPVELMRQIAPTLTPRLIDISTYDEGKRYKVFWFKAETV